MPYAKEQLKSIFDRTSGYCHICRKQLAFTNYGKKGNRGAWEVEHSKPKAKGGTNHLNNLYAACIPCNRDKGVVTTRTARTHHGTSSAPLSREKRENAKTINAAKGAAIGGFVGSFLGPLGTAAGAALGAKLGYNQNPDND